MIRDIVKLRIKIQENDFGGVHIFDDMFTFSNINSAYEGDYLFITSREFKDNELYFSPRYKSSIYDGYKSFARRMKMMKNNLF